MSVRHGARAIRRSVIKPRRSSRPALEALEARVVLSSWTEVPINFSNPQGTVLLSDGRLLVEQFGTDHWWLVSPDSSGNYADPSIVQAHDSFYIHEYSGLALLKDGEVMVSGAEDPHPGDPNYDPATTGVDRIEIYNPADNSWREVAKPAFFGNNVITDNSIKVLPDGRVLASTGNSAIYGLYDPVANTWTQTQSIPSGSSNEVTLTMLNSGLVLAVGTGTAGNRSWVFDESIGTWTEVGQTPGMLNTGEGGPMVQLPGGDVLAVGAVPYWGLTQTALYSPATQTWLPAASISAGSIGEVESKKPVVEQSYRLVPRLAPGLALEVQNGSASNATAIDVGTWSQANQQVWQFANAGVGIFALVPTSAINSALTDGNQIELSTLTGIAAQRWTVTSTADGYFTLSPASAPGSSLEFSQGATTADSKVVIDTTNGSMAQEWRLIHNPNTSIGDEPLAALPSGHVLIAMRQNSQSVFYEYDPAADRWKSVPDVPNALTSDDRVDLMNMTVLPSGQVLVTGAGGSHVFLYTPDSGPQAAWKPRVVSITPTAPGSSTSWVSGWGLNGISEGGVFGDDNSTGSNYPLVQLIDRFGHVTYATTSNWTTTQVGDNFEGFQFTPPANLPYGEYTLRVIASGIASDPVAYHNALNPSGQGLTSGAIYELVPEDNQGLALTSVGGGKAGTSPWNGLASQRWEILDAGGGLFTIAPGNAPRKVLGGAEALGQPVTVGKADGSGAQSWTITPSGDGFYDLSPQSNPLATLGDGSPAQPVIDTDAISQRWRLVPVDTVANGLYRLSPLNRSGKALAVQGAAPPGLTPASLTKWRGRAGQEWDLTNVGGGFVTLAPLKAPGLRLEVLPASSSPGAIIGIGPVAAGSISQEWHVSLNADGSFRLVPDLAPELSLDSRAIAHGATMPILVSASNRSRTQEWSLRRLTVANRLKVSARRNNGPVRPTGRIRHERLG